MEIRIKFTNFKEIPTSRDAWELMFYYEIINNEYIGKPEEKSRTECNRIKVSISGTLQATWNANGLEWNDFSKVLFEYGKRHIIQKIKDGTISEYVELVLISGNTPSPCEFDPKVIPDPIGYSENIILPESKLINNMDEKENIGIVAGEIIKKRDNINAVFKEKHNESLLLISQERTLMDLYRDALSSEEFVSRIAAIAILVQAVNIKKLNEIMEQKESEGKSINTLEQFLKSKNIEPKGIIDVFRNIISLRKLYPIHGDHTNNVISSHKFFGLKYPIEYYSSAYITIKKYYADALNKLFDALYKLYEKKD